MNRQRIHFTTRAAATYILTPLLIFSIAITGMSSSGPGLFVKAASTSPCQKQVINGITSLGDDGQHVPAKVLDNNLKTRWSNLGIGSFITADLGGQESICSVDIAWYRGNLRQNNFVVSVSNDGTSFTSVFTAKSSGTTVSPETYSLPQEMTGRYVRVTVNGNTENNWASITELSIDGFSTSSSIPQNVPPKADNKTVQTIINTPVEIALTGTDPDPADTLTFSIAGLPQHGGLSAGSGPNSLTYIPDEGFIGSDSIAYQATDSQGVSGNVAIISIKVDSSSQSPPPPPRTNTPPTVNDIQTQTNINTPIEITLTGTDPDPGDTIKFAVTNLPQHGNLTQGTIPDGVLYNPDPGFSGTDSFTYQATDSQGAESSNTATVTVTVSGPSGNFVDPFGIREIYPTRTGGEQWFMNMNDIAHDPRMSFTAAKPTLTRNPDGSWKVSSTEVRLNVFTSSGYHHELINTLNQQQLAEKGYMQSPNDWRDVEITGYLKLNKQGGNVHGHSGSLSGGHYTFYARGGRHVGFGAPEGGCEATSYHGNWAYDGKTRFAKEQWHVSYVFTHYKPSTNSIAGKWVGFKTIMYNMQQNGKIAVKNEIWVDADNNGKWIKVNDFVDSGGFGKAGGECGGAPDQIIMWGGPIVTYRWDNSPDVDVKDLSVREIQAPQ